MNKAILVKLVKEEARKLKKESTKEERRNLNLSRLNVGSQTNCIYGQMTGDCVSERAHHLIMKCTERVYKRDDCDIKLNGKTQFDDDTTRNGTNTDVAIEVFSPIETFIMEQANIENGNNGILINYLKGKTDRLNFKPF